MVRTTRVCTCMSPEEAPSSPQRRSSLITAASPSSPLHKTSDVVAHKAAQEKSRNQERPVNSHSPKLISLRGFDPHFLFYPARVIFLLPVMKATFHSGEDWGPKSNPTTRAWRDRSIYRDQGENDQGPTSHHGMIFLFNSGRDCSRTDVCGARLMWLPGFLAALAALAASSNATADVHRLHPVQFPV